MKPFSWSFSKLKSFETCPKKFYECDLQRNYKEEGEYLVWGNQVHKAFEQTIGKGIPMPKEFKTFAALAESIRNANGRVLVEQKFAINDQFQPCPYFDKAAWYRGIADVVILNGKKALAFDWKTGKVQRDSVQLMLMAQCIFAHFPEVEEVHTYFVWLKHPEAEPTHEVYTRTDVSNAWIGLLLRVKLMQAAYASQTFPPKPSGLCRAHCPVVSCPHHGKGGFR